MELRSISGATSASFVTLFCNPQNHQFWRPYHTFDVSDHPKHLDFRSCLAPFFDPIYEPIWNSSLSYCGIHFDSTLGSLAGIGAHLFLFVGGWFLDDCWTNFMIVLGSQNGPQRASNNFQKSLLGTTTRDYVSWPPFGSIWAPFGLPSGCLWIHSGLPCLPFGILGFLLVAFLLIWFAWWLTSGLFLCMLTVCSLVSWRDPLREATRTTTNQRIIKYQSVKN